MIPPQTVVLQLISGLLHIPITELNHNCSFVAQGGNSLDAVSLSQACKQSGILLAVQDILRAFSVADIVDAASLQPTDDLINNKSTAYIGFNPRDSQQIQRPNRYPVTDMQLTFINGSEARPGTNIIRHQQPCAPERISVLKQAWKNVLEAEPIFRTRFELKNGIGYLVEIERPTFEWEEVIANSEEEYQAILEELPTMTEVSFRFKVVIQQLPNSQPTVACVMWSVHHALVDGFSMQILLDRVENVGRGHLAQPGPSFALLSTQLRQLQQTLKAEGREFWEEQTARFPAASGEILLPPPSETSEKTRSLLHSITPDISQSRLQSYAKELAVTPASIYMAAWALVLSQFSDSDTVVFGTVISGRNLDIPGVLETVGPLVNTLPLHVSLEDQIMSSKLLKKVFSQLLELASFHWTTPEHGYRREFSSAVAMQYETAMRDDFVGYPNQTTRTLINSDIPLSIMVAPDGELHMHYLSTHFSVEQVELLGHQYAKSLRALCRPSYTVQMCREDLMGTSFRQRLMDYGNCCSGLTTETSIDDDLVTLFERAVTNDPATMAIERTGYSMSYRELDEKSSRLACYLKDTIHVCEGEIICVHADQSMNWIVAIYAILKANGIYCPLNQNLTPELRSSIFESSTSRFFIVPDVFDAVAKPPTCEALIPVEEILTSTEFTHDAIESSWRVPRANPTPAAAAYLCFTSGSTGKPKGVICTHRGLVAFQRDREVRLFAGPGKRIAQLMSVSFDGSIHELFSALSYGATLVLPDSTGPFDHVKRVDSAILTPSVAKVLRPSDFPALTNVYLVGEPVPQHVNDSWAASKQLYNMYGPTEATCGATITRLVSKKPPTIGRPNPTTRIYILNSKRQMVLPGVIGEIYLAGVQVSNGYLNRPDATRERFFEDKICAGLRERMYATGDLGYWNQAGDLVCLGRNDRQIKLRGFRLDLDDLETRIARLPGVTAAAVVRQNDHLVTMLQPSSLCITAIRPQLAGILPVHAIPKYILAVDQFPLTAVGKRDYRQILAMVAGARTPTSEKLTTCEYKIACIWAELLEIPSLVRISSESGFIELGGHSILQLRLASRLSSVFGLAVSPRLVIEAGTLRDLALEVEKLSVNRKPGKVEENGLARKKMKNTISCRQLSPMETEWLTKYVLDCGTSAFTVSLAFEVRTPKRRMQLIKAWDQVLARHEILRSRYVQGLPGCFHRKTFEHRPQVQLVRSLNLWKEVNRPFRLDMEYPVRVLSSPDITVITATHTVCDLTTMQLLLNEVTSICEGNPALPIDRSYIDSDVWSQVGSEEDMEFWAEYLADIPPPEFPLLPKFPLNRVNYHGTSYIALMPPGMGRNMSNFTNRNSITPHQLSLAAVALALQPDSDTVDVLLGAPHLNRPSVSDMETVGLFLEPLGVRVQSPSETMAMSTKSFLEGVQRSSQAVLAHAVPWTQLWRHFDSTAEFPNHPLFDVMVSFHGHQNSLELPLDGTQPLYTWAQGSKFKLMFEFSAISAEELLLRIEYDHALFSYEDINRTQFLVRTALDLLIRESEWGDIKSGLKRAMDATPDTSGQLDPGTVFGMKIEELCNA
ncbi:hypothetical protein N7516_000671 [Penicillium verrucosum]|uniref:uncharacterized protein n=1 Tax=Penicillium verrucosum TaxID=60171 RepID=UPI002545BD1D|nr:uncharacterized protein N7516_000671 [Penicillium verrucosum]KAJ5940503.1 hypothetical protein N7516_000671 [Penicillium verrucosum]